MQGSPHLQDRPWPIFRLFRVCPIPVRTREFRRIGESEIASSCKGVRTCRIDRGRSFGFSVCVPSLFGQGNSGGLANLRLPLHARESALAGSTVADLSAFPCVSHPCSDKGIPADWRI